jgi:hypothetical protein
MTLHLLHAKAGLKSWVTLFQIGNELLQGRQELPLLLWVQALPIAPE